MINVHYLSSSIQLIRIINLQQCNKFSSRRKQIFNPTYQQFSTMSADSTTSYNYMYLHGFASGEGSSKGKLLKKFFAEQTVNVELQLPDLNIPTFDKLSVTSIVEHLKNEILSNKRQYRLIGSSLGGLIAATLAHQLQESSKINSLILLCPALDAANRWKEKLPESELQKWKLEGTKKYYHFDSKCELPLHYEFYEDLERQVQYPLMDVPTTIIHGLNDDVVPISTSRTYVELLRKNGQNTQLIEVNDDHFLVAAESTDAIKNLIKGMWLDKK